MRHFKESVSQVGRLIDEWDFEKNEAIGLFPDKISAQSQQKAWWKCKYGHSWEARISNRYHGRSCRYCNLRQKTSFPEQALFYYVKKVYPNAVNGYRPDFLGGMELDIFIPDINLGIEYDGKAWHTEENSDRDLRKYTLCRENNIVLWRIKEEKIKYTPLNAPANRIFSIDHIQQKEKLGLLIQHLLDELDPRSNKWTREKITDIHSQVDVNLLRDEYEIREYQSVIRNGAFKDKQPEAAKSWHPTKNKSLRPEMFSENSNVKVWWICDKGHEWKTSITVRSRGQGCPYCSGKKVLPGFNDLATTYPEIATEWDCEKNNNKTPQMFTGGSGAKAWWKCSCGHSWEAKINNRTINHRGCPYCAHEKAITGENDIQTLYPEVAAEWHPSLNGEKRPEQFLPASNIKVWWKCSKCGYEYEASITNRVTKGTGCKNCAGQVLHPGVNDLETLYPEIAQEWDYGNNNGLKPSEVCPKLNKNYAWIDPLGHRWITTPSSRTAGRGCPYCSGNKVLEGFNDLVTTHPDVAAEWHPTKNGDLLPTQVSKGYKFKVWFLCPVCGNDYDSLISNKINGFGKCPFCSPRKTRAKSIMNVETGELFSTLKEAAASVGKSDYRQIHMCCKGRCKTASGYHWKYVE